MTFLMCMCIGYLYTQFGVWTLELMRWAWGKDSIDFDGSKFDDAFAGFLWLVWPMVLFIILASFVLQLQGRMLRKNHESSERVKELKIDIKEMKANLKKMEADREKLIRSQR